MTNLNGLQGLRTSTPPSNQGNSRLDGLRINRGSNVTQSQSLSLNGLRSNTQTIPQQPAPAWNDSQNVAPQNFGPVPSNNDLPPLFANDIPDIPNPNFNQPQGQYQQTQQEAPKSKSSNQGLATGIGVAVGAVAGAVIGSFVAPGPGTAGGIALGTKLGALLGLAVGGIVGYQFEK